MTTAEKRFCPVNDPKCPGCEVEASTPTLPTPNIENWEFLYQDNARALCIKDNPPMRGFGKPIKSGDLVLVDSVCFVTRYEIGVREQCAFYELEGYFQALSYEEAEEHIRANAQFGVGA